MNENVTLTEEYILPSKGKIYGKPFDPIVKLRSMTVAEEMKRLSPSKNPYKTMSEIIESCLLTKLPVSVYDLCLGDYVYLLHKLRITTYGPDYTINYVCPFCNQMESTSIDLDSLKVNEYDESVDELMSFTLPKSNKKIKLRFQTPRDLDFISNKVEEIKKMNDDPDYDPTILLTLQSIIEEVDDKPVNQITFMEAIKQLPAADYNVISQKSAQLQRKVGIDTVLDTKCNNCGRDVKTLFRYTSEFFGPEVN